MTQPRGQHVVDKILGSADKLFYCQGYNATGINQIVEEAGVAETPDPPDPKQRLLAIFDYHIGRQEIREHGGCPFIKANDEAGIATRFVQGVSASFMVPQTIAFIQVLFTDAKERAKAFGMFGITLGAAAVIGQVLGGYLSSALGVSIIGYAPTCSTTSPTYSPPLLLFFRRLLVYIRIRNKYNHKNK